MESKSGFAVGANSKGNVLIAKAQSRGYIAGLSALFVLLSITTLASLAGLEIFQPVSGDSSPNASPTSDSVSVSANSFQKTVSGNSYYRSMSESMSVIAGNGNSGTSSPVSYQRSVLESLSLTTNQGKVPNSYSRSMSEQASLTTGMPSSTAPVAAQPNRASPAPYSAGSIQRIEERFNLRSPSAGKADSTYRGTAAGPLVISTDSAILNAELAGSKDGIIIQNTASVDASEGETGDHSSVLKYVLPSMGAAQYNAGYSHANFVLFSTEGLIVLAIALHKSRTVTSIARKIATICGAQVHIVACSSYNDKTTLQTRVIIILLVFFSTTALASISSPIFGQVSADTNAAGAAYRSNSGTSTLNSPKYREYAAGTGTWSSEVELPSVGQNVRSVFLLFNPINSQRVIISYDTNGDIDLFRCSSSCTSAANWYNVGTVATTQSYGTTNPYLPVCAAYEHTSGRLVIVYDKSAIEANDFYYRTFDGSSLSSEVGFNYIGAGASDNEEIRYCDLASKPTSGSNDLALIIEDATNQDAYAFIWVATANSGAGGWSSQRTVTLTMGATSITGNAVAIGYQTSSGAAVAFAGADTNACASERYTTSWTTIACTDPNTSNNNDVKFVHAYRDPANTDNLMFCQVDDLADITCAQIDGSTWGVWTEHTKTGDGANTHAAFSFAWDPIGSIGHVFVETSGTADTTVAWSSWTDSTSSWAIPSTLTTASSVHNWFFAATNPTAADTLDKLFIKINSLFDAGIIKKDTGTNPVLVGEQTLTNDQTLVTFEHQADIVFQLSTAAPSFTRPMSEQLGITDTNGRSIAATRALSDQLILSEKISIGISKPIVEQLSAMVTVSPSIAAITEPLFLTDTLTKADSKSMVESLALGDSLVRSANVSRLVSEQLGLLDGVISGKSSAKTISEQLAITGSITTYLAPRPVELLTLTDNIISSSTFTRSISENLSILDSASRTSSRLILESLNIQDQFTNIAVSFQLILTETLVLPDSLVTNQFGQFNQLATHTLTIGDSVILSLQSGKNGTLAESMNLQDAVGVLVVIPPPPSPPAITTMPTLTMGDARSLDIYGGLTNPIKAVKVNGVWNTTALDKQGLQTVLNNIGMPVYGINAEAASTGVDQMTIILPAFRIYTNIDGQLSDDAIFLTPTLSRLPAGIHVIVPINVQASIDGAQNLHHLGNITLTFTSTQSVNNFTMMISLLDNNPERMTRDLPANLAAFYVKISIVGDFSGPTPDNPAFFQQSPRIEFTLTEAWAQTHNVKRDSNRVPIAGVFLLDEGTGQWAEIPNNNISSLPSSSNSYTYSATLPHFSTYVVTANTQISSTGGSSHAKFVIPLTDSLLISSGMHTGATMGSEGKVVFKDITEFLRLSIIQPQPLHQHVINIEDVSVAVSITDIRSAIFGTAIATLNFEITNKGDTTEKLILRYSYTDPATGKSAYNNMEIVSVNAGQVIVKTVEIPFTSTGVFDVVIEAESDKRTVATTNIAVDVPWLTVYLQLLVIIAVAIVLISIGYVIRLMRTSKSFIIGGK